MSWCLISQAGSRFLRCRFYTLSRSHVALCVVNLQQIASVNCRYDTPNAFPRCAEHSLVLRPVFLKYERDTSIQFLIIKYFLSFINVLGCDR